jgi:hypothetical protein
MARPNRRKLVIVERPDLGQCTGPSGPMPVDSRLWLRKR